MRYHIVVDRPVGPLTLTALEGFHAVDGDEPGAHLEGEVVDDAALQGVLHQLHDLRLSLLSVHRLD